MYDFVVDKLLKKVFGNKNHKEENMLYVVFQK